MRWSTCSSRDCEPAASAPSATLGPVFEALDFVYMPSRDAAADARYFTETLAAELVFAVEGMGTRVAMVALAPDAPRILLAEHLEGDRPVLAHRVPDLDAAMTELKTRADPGPHLEIPFGPVRTSPHLAGIGSRSTNGFARTPKRSSLVGATEVSESSPSGGRRGSGRRRAERGRALTAA